MANKISILMVDDDTTLRSLYSQIFKDAGFEVDEANDGLEGLAMALKNKPNIVFTGIVMPRMTGFEMIEQLKKNLEYSTIPFVIFSHMGREEDKTKAEALGASAFLVKGMITPAEIIQKIRNILQGSDSYKVVLSEKFDAERLRKYLKVSGDMNFEFTQIPGEASNVFKAKLISDK